MPYPLPAGVPLEEWDAFHSVIVTDELSRCGSGGVCISTYDLRSKLSICFLGSLGFMRWFRYVFSIIYHYISLTKYNRHWASSNLALWL